MTAQETDSVFYKGRKYDLIGSSRGELLFDIFKFGLKPEMISTACYRGFFCDYTLNTNGLFVRKLTVYDKSGNYPVIRSVKPKIVEDYLAVYNKPDIKGRVRQGQIRANISANAEMLATYWDVGKMIHQRQQIERWGAGVIPRLAKGLRNELSEVKGFSERNLDRMMSFYKEY